MRGVSNDYSLSVAKIMRGKEASTLYVYYIGQCCIGINT
jgi:hypothetical protein